MTPNTFALSQTNTLQKSVVRKILRSGPSTIRELSDSVMTSVSHMQRLVERLEAKGILRSSKTEAVGRGRIPQRYALNPDFGYFIGVNIKTDLIEVAVVDCAGSTLKVSTRPTAGAEPINFTNSIPTILADVRKIMKNESSSPLLGVGVGVPGLVDASAGRVIYLPNMPQWENVALAALIEKRLGTTCRIDNTVRCMTLAEAYQGVGGGGRDLLFVYVGDGVGAGLFKGGTLYRGKHGGAIEFGHVRISESGPLCKCGNKGCLEAYVSKYHILENARATIERVSQSSLTGVISGGRFGLAEINTAALAGDKIAHLLVHEVGERLGIGLSMLVNLFDPERLVVGGEVFDAFGDELVATIHKGIRINAMNVISSRVVIEKSKVCKSPGAVGAALMSRESQISPATLG